jgi:DnaJ family protein C protein 7
MLFVIQLLDTVIYVYLQVVFCMDRILEQAPCTKFKLKKAECLAFLGRYQEAQEIAK